jgi:hypothetical protein
VFCNYTDELERSCVIMECFYNVGGCSLRGGGGDPAYIALPIRKVSPGDIADNKKAVD